MSVRLFVWKLGREIQTKVCGLRNAVMKVTARNRLALSATCVRADLSSDHPNKEVARARVEQATILGSSGVLDTHCFFMFFRN